MGWETACRTVKHAITLGTPLLLVHIQQMSYKSPPCTMASRKWPHFVFQDAGCTLCHAHLHACYRRNLFNILYTFCISSRPYTSRSSSSGTGEGSTGRSVFNRLGGPAGGAFARLSGLGGDRRGESWHKITVSFKECTVIDPFPPWRRTRKGGREWVLIRIPP